MHGRQVRNEMNIRVVAGPARASASTVHTRHLAGTSVQTINLHTSAAHASALHTRSLQTSDLELAEAVAAEVPTLDDVMATAQEASRHHRCIAGVPRQLLLVARCSN